MNRKQKKSIKTTILAMVLVGLILVGQVLQVMAASTGQITVTVSTLPALLAAIDNAQEGDIIGIRYGLNVLSDAVIGDPNKQVILKRADGTSFLDVKGGNTVLIQNIIFDGGGFTSLYPFVMINNNVTFENAVFRNSITNTAGGAAGAFVGVATFKNCLFENNRAIAGGHISVTNEATVNFENCTLNSGYAVSRGGAIFNVSSGSTVHITSSIITGNQAGDFGGGVVNNGLMTIAGTKLYDNIATNGGADIGNTGWLDLEDSIEALVDLFKDDGIVPTGWVNDYDFEAGIFIPEIDPSVPNSLLKLAYEVPPTEVVLQPSSLGVAGDGKITGLESGKYYSVTLSDIISYSKADGTLTTIESEAEPLTGTEIIGLINGETYLVEEYTPPAPEPAEPPTEPSPNPEPTTVLLDQASLGIAENTRIIGLESGKWYKVTVDDLIYFTKSDGSLSANESEAGSLAGSEIIGLTNGLVYMVEEYIPAPTEPGTPIEDPEEPTEPGTEDPTERPDEQAPPNGEDQGSPPAHTPSPTPSPSPTPTHNSGSSGGSSSYTPIKPIVTKPVVVLSSGKAVLDTTKTEYLLGYMEGLMSNKNTVTRAQFAHIVYKLLTTESLKAVYTEKNNFKDVTTDAWYNKAVSTITNAGLISVGSDRKFHPDRNITWGEMVTVLAKFAEPNSEWKIITRHWAKDAINTAISYRWFEYNDQFNPDGEVTCDEMLNFINTMFTWSKNSK